MQRLKKNWTSVNRIRRLHIKINSSQFGQIECHLVFVILSAPKTNFEQKRAEMFKVCTHLNTLYQLLLLTVSAHTLSLAPYKRLTLSITFTLMYSLSFLLLFFSSSYILFFVNYVTFTKQINVKKIEQFC